jgi:hypothetical protein
MFVRAVCFFFGVLVLFVGAFVIVGFTAWRPTSAMQSVAVLFLPPIGFGFVFASFLNKRNRLILLPWVLMLAGMFTVLMLSAEYVHTKDSIYGIASFVAMFATMIGSRWLSFKLCKPELGTPPA